MSKDEQGELKEFYDSMKDLFEALSKMEDIELEALDKDAPKEEEKEEKKEEKRQLYNYMPPTVRRVLQLPEDDPDFMEHQIDDSTMFEEGEDQGDEGDEIDFGDNYWEESVEKFDDGDDYDYDDDHCDEIYPDGTCIAYEYDEEGRLLVGRRLVGDDQDYYYFCDHQDQCEYYFANEYESYRQQRRLGETVSEEKPVEAEKPAEPEEIPAKTEKPPKAEKPAKPAKKEPAEDNKPAEPMLTPIEWPAWGPFGWNVSPWNMGPVGPVGPLGPFAPMNQAPIGSRPPSTFSASWLTNTMGAPHFNAPTTLMTGGEYGPPHMMGGPLHMMGPTHMIGDRQPQFIPPRPSPPIRSPQQQPPVQRQQARQRQQRQQMRGN